MECQGGLLHYLASSLFRSRSYFGFQNEIDIGIIGVVFFEPNADLNLRWSGGLAIPLNSLTSCRTDW